jgi:hypothetical protein
MHRSVSVCECVKESGGSGHGVTGLLVYYVSVYRVCVCVCVFSCVLIHVSFLFLCCKCMCEWGGRGHGVGQCVCVCWLKDLLGDEERGQLG